MPALPPAASSDVLLNPEADQPSHTLNHARAAAGTVLEAQSPVTSMLAGPDDSSGAEIG
jgi:hypothetical protein